MTDAGPAAALLIHRAAATERMELDRCCWVEVTRGLVPDPAPALGELVSNTAWQRGEVLRYDRYIPERRLGAWLRVAERPLLRQLELHLQARYRHPLTGASAVLYRDGQDFQGLHGDHELRWLHDTLVAIVVLGQRRPFQLRRRAPNPDGTAMEHVLDPGDGDLVVMGGSCQRHWLHGVPAATAGPNLPRLSLTWRWTSRHGPPDTNPSYFDGRQFSDRPRQRGHRSRPV